MHSVVERLKTMSLEAKIDDSVSQSAQVNLSLVKFADDVTGVTVCDNEHQVQKSLELMAQEYKKCFAANGLKINVLKSEHIVFLHFQEKSFFLPQYSKGRYQDAN